jgi:hypothetical protein
MQNDRAGPRWGQFLSFRRERILLFPGSHYGLKRYNGMKCSLTATGLLTRTPLRVRIWPIKS